VYYRRFRKAGGVWLITSREVHGNNGLTMVFSYDLPVPDHYKQLEHDVTFHIAHEVFRIARMKSQGGELEREDPP
jgi:hypothetical protein